MCTTRLRNAVTGVLSNCLSYRVPYFPGAIPIWMNGCDSRKWHIPNAEGEDCRTTAESGRSRYLTLNLPMGYAFYRDVAPDVAAKFDRIIDSMCWAEWNKTQP